MRYDSGKVQRKILRTYKHSGDIGDLIYSLPVIPYFGSAILYLNPKGLKSKKFDGSRSGLDEKSIAALRPLLEKQIYIKKLSNWSDEDIEVDLDSFRKLGIKYHTVNLCQEILKTFNTPFSMAQKPWLYADSKRVVRAVFHRTNRYLNKRMDYGPYLKKYKGSSIFVGFRDEWKQFVKDFGPIEYYPTKDLWEAACVINGSDIFLSNQSGLMAIAVALGKTYVQEVAIGCANCIFERPNAKYIR